MGQIIEFLNTYRVVIGAVVVMLAASLVISRWWSEVKLFWKSAWYGLPFVGRVKSLSKDTARDESGWFRSEKILCDDFYSDISRIAGDPLMYDRSKSYLGKVQELGRKELSLFMWGVIIALVFVEALGFAYVLSGYTLPGASENLQVQGAFGIAFLISAVLVWLTHSAGSELHKRGLIKKARAWWLHDASDDRPSLIGSSNKVSLEKDHVDDDDPNYIQIVHRLETNAHVSPGVPVWTILTVVAVLFVAVGATIVRYETYLQEKVAETTLQPSPSSEGGFDLQKLMGNSAPDILAQPQQEADAMADDDREGSMDTANMTTFAMLAFLFVLIQAMGIGIGYKTGFAGKESRDARRIIGSFKSRSEYETWFERKRDAVARVAQKHLSNLQAGLSDQAQLMGIDKEDRSALQNAADRTYLAHHASRLEQEELRRESEEKRIEKAERRRADSRNIRQSSASIEKQGGNLKPSEGHGEVIPMPRKETREEMEARIRAELEAEAKARQETEAAGESEEMMRARLRKEMAMEDDSSSSAES